MKIKNLKEKNNQVCPKTNNIKITAFHSKNYDIIPNHLEVGKCIISNFLSFVFYKKLEKGIKEHLHFFEYFAFNLDLTLECTKFDNVKRVYLEDNAKIVKAEISTRTMFKKEKFLSISF